ncbi:MAG TPA: hypothetical protein VNM22_15935 [Candidatus Limnocylindrales bacterium]|nr:hypothetical protein [Candidatus Limnocylindrales bacterium]
MNCCNKNEDDKSSQGTNNLQMGVKDLLKMGACCVGPLAGAAVLGAFGINASFLAALACPLMMGYMMWRMGRMQPSKGQSSEVEGAPGVRAGLKPAPMDKSAEQFSPKSIKELPDLPKAQETAGKDLPGEGEQGWDESKMNEEKVQTKVVTEIKPVSAGPDGAKGERESYERT